MQNIKLIAFLLVAGLAGFGIALSFIVIQLYHRVISLFGTKATKL